MRTGINEQWFKLKHPLHLVHVFIFCLLPFNSSQRWESANDKLWGRQEHLFPHCAEGNLITAFCTLLVYNLSTRVASKNDVRVSVWACCYFSLSASHWVNRRDYIQRASSVKHVAAPSLTSRSKMWNRELLGYLLFFHCQSFCENWWKSMGWREEFLVLPVPAAPSCSLGRIVLCWLCEKTHLYLLVFNNGLTTWFWHSCYPYV